MRDTYRDGVWFVDGDNVGVQMKDSERVGGDWRLVAMYTVDK